MIQSVVSLAGVEPAFIGRERRVYVAPGAPDLLLKVPAPRRQRSRTSLQRLLDRISSARKHRGLLREARAALEAMLHAERVGRAPPVAAFRGMVLTSDGLGVLTDHIRGSAGTTAPTLRDIADAGGLVPEVLERLNAFLTELYAFRLPVNDLRPHNIVLAADGRLVLVDGFGRSSLVPLARWIPALAARRIDRQAALLARKLGLGFDPRARRLLPAA